MSETNGKYATACSMSPASAHSLATSASTLLMYVACKLLQQGIAEACLYLAWKSQQSVLLYTNGIKGITRLLEHDGACASEPSEHLAGRCGQHADNIWSAN